MEARTIVDGLPGEIAKRIICLVESVFTMTKEPLKILLSVKNIDDICQFHFAYDVPNRADCEAFMLSVAGFVSAYQNVLENLTAETTAYNQMLKDDVKFMMAQDEFVSIMGNLNQFIKSTNVYFMALANKLATAKREKNAEHIVEVIDKINAIVKEAMQRTDKLHADRQRFYDVEDLYDRCNVIYQRCHNQSPQQIMTELCEAITQCIEGIQETTFGVQSTTVAKLEEVLKTAKQYTIKGGSPAISHQGAPPQLMIAEIKTFFDLQLGNVGAPWASCNGVSRIIPILNDENKSVAKKFDEIKTIAIERLNARDWLGYPVNRDPNLAQFYHSIKHAKIDRLKMVKQVLENKQATTSALRMSQ